MTISVAILYALSFLGARLITHSGLDKRLVHNLLRHLHSPTHLLIGIMCITLGLSMFVPNTIAILMVLPIVLDLSTPPHDSTSTATSAPNGARTNTLFALAIIYAANIGGLASMVGSPANGLLLLTLDSQQIPTEQLTIFRWFTFGLPLACVLLALAVVVLHLGFARDIRAMSLPRYSAPLSKAGDSSLIRFAMTLCFLGPIGASMLPTAWGDIPSIVLFVGTYVVMFHIRSTDHPVGLLRHHDLIKNLPWKGIGFVAVAIAVAGVLQSLNAIQPIVEVLRTHAPSMDTVTLYLTLIVATTFTTEVLSNSVTAVAFWAIALACAGNNNLDVLPLLVAIGMASTCAFMSPLATPSTALAYGSIPAVRVKYMLVLGAVMNVLAALWLAFSFTTWVPSLWTSW